ncbi:hypothetical protein [Enterococcus termitis]|uniref:Uncharacterized protein n=1 Tax=Enterococcus termitis TaxID=332950 RepID=A0A1E5GWD3_9ENTE|nr:hypothetical protein [Enterococcus termitis]OEG16620.1 hypothetical protein BCR25_03205 [Enterococcus termitis]OJG99304.1 hypothetical protein RV18_GL001372 [Enterococcus termitis]
MKELIINKNKLRDTATIPELGMLAYRIFPDTNRINIQLLMGEQEEATIICQDGEVFTLRDQMIRLVVK